MLTTSECYVNPKVSGAALNAFFASFVPGKSEIHTFEAYYRGELLVRAASAPYSPADKREIYSLSKSFCSTAVGLLCDAGVLSVEDRIVDLFPDKLPETVSENLGKMRLRHVLSMNTGHAACVMPFMADAPDAAKAFLAQPVPFEPGTHFAYNTGATCLLSCLVERLTGKKTVDYLSERLFVPMDIAGVRWSSTADGTNDGGTGIHVSCDDIAKLGLLYAAGGVWKGRRLLSRAWVDMATSYVSDNSGNGSPDWCAGYGFQFWRNAREGYRGDGAFGQLCFVLPEHDMVFALQTEVDDMQREIDCLYTLADHLLDDGDHEDVILPTYLPARSERKTAGFEHTLYRLDPNPMGWTQMFFRYDTASDAMQAVISDGEDAHILQAGNGHFEESRITAKEFKPMLTGLMCTAERQMCRFAASYAAEENRITFSVRYLNAPHRLTFVFRTEDGGKTLRMEADARGLLKPASTVLTGHAE